MSDAYLAICGVPLQCRRRCRPRPELACMYLIAHYYSQRTLYKPAAHDEDEGRRDSLTESHHYLFIPTQPSLNSGKGRIYRRSEFTSRRSQFTLHFRFGNASNFRPLRSPATDCLPACLPCLSWPRTAHARARAGHLIHLTAPARQSDFKGL